MSAPTPVAPLETPRLLLRGLSLEDAPAYERHFVDYEVIRNLSREVPWPYPDGGVEEFLRSVLLPDQGDDRWTWGLFAKSSPEECIGVVDLWRDGRPEHRGFWLGKTFWRRGLMTEAVSVVNDHAFEQLSFERLIFSNARGNLGSRRVKEKGGARFLRTEPALFVDPAFSEREIWETEKDEWIAFRRR